MVQFCTNAQACGVKTKVLVIGRDKNILHNQQNRIREESTIRHFLDQLPNFEKPTYLSYELLYLYKQEYLKSLDVGFPIAWYDERVNQILEQDANEKYIGYVKENPLDDGNKTGIPFPSNPNTPDKPSGDYLPCCGDKPCHCP